MVFDGFLVVEGHSIFNHLPAILKQRIVGADSDLGLGLIVLLKLIKSLAQERSGKEEAKQF